MSHSQFHSVDLFTLRHAWLNLWDKHMTTGRINQVATNRRVETTLSGNHFGCSQFVCVEFRLRPCISFAIVLYHCSAPASALSSKPSLSTARRTGSAAPAPWITALSGASNCFSNGWSNQWYIQLQRKVQVIQRRTTKHTMKKQKKKSEPTIR